MKFFCDGSAKGMAIGAGIVRVDEHGFMKTYSFDTLHAHASASIAELFALEQALLLVRELAPPEPVTIYVDSQCSCHVTNYVYANEQNEITFHQSLSDSYQNKIRSLFVEINQQVENMIIRDEHGCARLWVEVRKMTEQDAVYANIAHALSRTYLKTVDLLFTEHAKSLKEDLATSKKKVNGLTAREKSAELVIEKKKGIWIVQRGMKVVGQNKNPISALHQAILHQYDKMRLPIIVSEKAVMLLRSMYHNPKLPDEVAQKADVLYSMLLQNQIVTQKKRREFE